MRATALVTLLGACGARVITKPVTLNSREKLLAGGSARFGAQLIMYPADALRTLAQTRTGAKTLADLGYKTLISGCATTSSFAFFGSYSSEIVTSTLPFSTASTRKKSFGQFRIFANAFTRFSLFAASFCIHAWKS